MNDHDLKLWLAAQLPEDIYTGFAPAFPFVWNDKTREREDWKSVTSREWLHVVSLVEAKLTKERQIDYSMKLGKLVTENLPASRAAWMDFRLITASWPQRTRALMEVLK